MSGFTGFSEADIKKVQSGQSPSKSNVNHKTSYLNQPKKQQNEVIRSKHIMKESNRNNESIPIPEAAKLDTIKIVEFHNVEELKQDEPRKTETNDLEVQDKKLNLEEFEAKQKLIEEQNRKRKELLTKALADRTQKTIKEQQKLNEIQDEFKKLDANLSNDVKVLRSQIEAASLDYMEAQKKYLRAEKEFLDAKLYLHQKLERKQLLTEYLCAIIEKNEERKAVKLTELLQKLEIDYEGSKNPKQ